MKGTSLAKPPGYPFEVERMDTIWSSSRSETDTLTSVWEFCQGQPSLQAESASGGATGERGIFTTPGNGAYYVQIEGDGSAFEMPRTVYNVARTGETQTIEDTARAS